MVGVANAREPTGWTQPLQASVAAFYVATTLLFIIQLVISAGPTHDAIRDSLLRKPPAGIKPGEVSAVVNGTFALLMAFAVLLALIFVALAAASYFRRWAWVFFVDLVLLGLIAANNAREAAGIASLGLGVSLVSMLTALVAAAIFGWMIVAWTRFGIWACRRVTAGSAP